MNSLDKIALETCTDKGPQDHNFTKWYDLFFSPLKEKRINLLEIGIYKGQSIKMWEKYFPNAKIYAVDINPIETIFDTNKTKIFIGDQTDKNFMENIPKSIDDKFDIIIDDGGHTMKQQILTFETMFPFVKCDGYYVCEDLHTSYASNFKDYGDNTAINYFKNLVDDLNLKGKIWCGDKYKMKEFIDIKTLNYYEKTIEAIHFFKSICFIKKAKYE